MKLIDALVRLSMGKDSRHEVLGLMSQYDARWRMRVTMDQLNQEGWSVAENKPEPMPRKTKIVPVEIKGSLVVKLPTYRFDYMGFLFNLSDVLVIPNWTGRLKVTYADGTWAVMHHDIAFGRGSASNYKPGCYNGCYCGEPDFIPAVITGAEFWEEQ